jgi:hypothetical protein
VTQLPTKRHAAEVADFIQKLRPATAAQAPSQTSRGRLMRAARCLKRLGYRNTTQRINGKVTRCWVTKSHI